MKSKNIAWIWIIFYLLVAILIFRSDERFADLVTYVSIFVFILIVGRTIIIPSVSVWLFGAATLTHIAGVFPFNMNGKEVSLYYIYGNYDIFCHLFGFILFSIGLFCLYKANHKNPSKLDITIVLLALVGAGAIIEVSEYVGYRLFGIGEGYLKFGEGDNSNNFGPWGDSMTDSISNIAGILIGFIFYNIINYGRLCTKRI